MRSDEELEFLLDEAKKVFALTWTGKLLIVDKGKFPDGWKTTNLMLLIEHLPVTDATLIERTFSTMRID